jgi:hypothetical protein
MRYLWFLTVGVLACSSPSAGGNGGTGTADAKSDGLATGEDAKDASAADAKPDANLDAVDDALADAADDASAVDDAIADATDQIDIPGFFDDSSDDAQVVCGSLGTVKGVSCAPKAGVSVAFAAVSLDVDTPCVTGSTTWHADVTADAKGAYNFANVPPGSGAVKIVKGSFQTTIPVTIVGGSTVDLTQPTSDRCFKAGSVKIAVVQGDADQIESLLDDLGFTHDDYDTASGTSSAGAKFLANATKMATYDVIFVDCGSKLDSIMTGSAKTTIVTNVQNYVAAGHSLYASDWAWQIVENAFPNAIDFYGNDASTSKATAGPSTTAGPRQGPGPTLSEKKAGAAAYTMTGNIVDTGLAAVVGKSTTTIYEDLGTWVVMQAAGTGTVVEIESHVMDVAPATGDWGTVPLVVRFPSGAGHVVYTSFHNIAVKDAGAPVDDIKAILTYLVFTL